MIKTGTKLRLLSRALVLSMALVLSACSAGGAGGSDVAAMPYNLGNDAQFSDTSVFADGDITWIKIDVPTSTNIQSLSMFAKLNTFGVTANVRMSVYTDTGGYADKLVVGSEVETTLTNDLKLLTFDVASTPVAAGTYWVGFNADADIAVSSDKSGSVKVGCFVETIATSAAWPADVSPSWSTNSRYNLNVYITVLD